MKTSTLAWMLVGMLAASANETAETDAAGRVDIREAERVETQPTPVVQPRGEERDLTLITQGWVDVRSILRTIAGNANLGLDVAPDVDGKVNVHLVDVPLRSAIASVLEPIGLGWELVNGVLVVFKESHVTRWFTFDYPVTEREGRGQLSVSPRTASDGSGDSAENESHVTTYAVMNVWPQVLSSVATLVFEDQGAESLQEEDNGALSLADPSGRILVINPMAGLIRVTAEHARVRRVENFLERMEESLRRQVVISVQVFEVTTESEVRTGIDWQSLAQGDVAARLLTTEGLEAPVFNFTVDSEQGTALIEAIATAGDVKVLSTPRITTLNNQKAVVRVVREEVFFSAQVEPRVILNSGASSEPVVEYMPQIIPVGLVLDVTPQVGKDRVVTLNVHPTISHIVRIETSPNDDTQPVIAVRELDTVGSVPDGKTLVIAGLISEGVQKERSGVPILKDIPLLGYFFRRTHDKKTSTELVIMLTPMIVDEKVAGLILEEAEALMDAHD